MSTLQQILDTVDGRPTVAAYCAASRQLAATAAELPVVRIALLSSFTIEPLTPFLKVETARRGWQADVMVARFNTARQELLDPDGELVRFGPDIVFVAELLQDVCPDLADGWAMPAAAEIDGLIESAVASLASAISVFRSSSQAPVVVHNFALPRQAVMGVYDSMAESSQVAAIQRLNHRLGVELSRLPGVYVLDVALNAARVGLDGWHDERMWLLARTPLSTAAMVALARAQATFVRLLREPARKCLALDLDNTLWGGVVGDLGVSGIALGPVYPGNAFLQFQQFVLSLYHRGVVLAALSKNNEADVDEVFERHPAMILRRHHFAAVRINWQPKAENIREVAEELSLGTDAFVFFDDDGAECAWMRELRPEVLTVQAPQDLTRFKDAVIATGAFERLSMTAEDRRRGEMYAAASLRRRAAGAARSVDEFLESLAMSAVVRPADHEQLPRVADLLAKTNQFNMTTRRHSVADVAAMHASSDHEIFTLQLSDRFGDSGLVGVAIVRRDAADAVVDSLLLSCRVIGRRAETALLSCVVAWAREHGLHRVIGEFIPTAKNAPAVDCYQKHGFAPLPADGAVARWALAVQQGGIAWPSCIAVANAGVPA